MELKDQVCSLELAKRLKELGVEQESVFNWADYPGVLEPYLVYQQDKNVSYYYSAFTVAELGEMLPLEYMSVKREDGKLFVVGHRNNKGPWFQEVSEADARSKMLICLIEQGLVKQ